MSAARVLNPVSDFCKISAGVVNRSLPTQLKRIKRDLFGAANPVETTKIFTEELEKHQDKAIKKWGFDFRNGSPLTANSQYSWERVSFQESNFAPDMYTLTRAAHVRPSTTPKSSSMDLLMDERAERENNAALHTDEDEVETEEDSCDETAASPAAVFKVPSVAVANARANLDLRLSGGGQSKATSLKRKRQPKITEYMKERKRLAQTPKKVSPAKRMRTTSTSSIATLNITHSVHTHFMMRHTASQQQQQQQQRH